MNPDLEKVVNTVDGVLTVLKTIADTPGVNLLPYAAVASSAIGALKLAISAGRDIAPYVEAIGSTFGDGSTVPSEAEVAALDEKIIALEAAVQAPLPVPEEGEED